MRLSRTLVFIAVFLVTQTSRPVSAEPPPGGDEAEAAAAAHYDAGRAAQLRGDWKGAYDGYAKAYARYQRPQILVSLAVAEHRLGKWRDAAEHLTLFLAAPPAKLSAAERSQYAFYLAEAKQKVAILAIVTEAGADVSVGTRNAGAAGADGRLQVFVDPGKHEIAARRGARRGNVWVHVKPGTSTDVPLLLADTLPAPAALPASPGPAPAPAPAASSAAITPTSQMAPPARPAGPSAPATADAGAPSRPVIIAGAVLTGLGFSVAIGTGVATAIVAVDARELGTRISPGGDTGACAGVAGGDCQKLRDLRHRQAVLFDTAVWSGATGLFAGMATLLYGHLAGERPSAARSTTLVPVVTQSAGGLAVTGAW